MVPVEKQVSHRSDQQHEVHAMIWHQTKDAMHNLLLPVSVTGRDQAMMCPALGTGGSKDTALVGCEPRTTMHFLCA